MIQVKSEKLKWTVWYEMFFTVLAVIAVFLATLDISGYINLEDSIKLSYIDSAILLIFTADYAIRLLISRDKKRFIRNNLLDLVAIIPYNSMFRVFRAFRLFRVLRVTKAFKATRIIRAFAFLEKARAKADQFVNTNGFIYVLYVTIVTVMLGAIGIYFVEYKSTVYSFGDALWWSFVTATTVGYGDISPTTLTGRLIAAVLMLIGIGFIGMLTGTIATYFLNLKKVSKEKINEVVVDLSDLEDQKIEEILNFIEFVKSKN